MNNSTSHPANNIVPVQLGHYQLRDCIGRGGMGLVYRARDTRLERDVAIKCLRTELFEAHYIERFKREALLLAKLNHPNIVQIYDFIEAPEQVALVMELVDGQNLQLYLREHLVPITQRLQWLVQISEGLAVAHDAGIIHRDLKTENILINKRGQAKITDLGIAKSQDFNATITDHVAGSYCSMSPEQAMGEAITFKSDLFSLGILAYQLLCGAHPFGDTNNKLQTMQRIISHPPTAPQKHNPDLPIEFVDLLGQLLSKDPDKRPDNTHWVAAQFTKLKELTWHDDALGDDTQALAIPLPTNTKAVRTQDHPTFDTRFVAAATAPKNSIWQKIKNYIANNKIIVSSAMSSFLIIAGVVAWQLQPKPPKYVAVIPPKLTAEGMQESQQELVKGAVYDAIQQSVIQLDGYYLIPSSEIAEINGDSEAIHKATNADELIATTIQCKIESCTISLSRILPDSTNIVSRLRVEKTKTIDTLTDNNLLTAEIVQTNVGFLYEKTINNNFEKISESDYKAFLEASQSLRHQGANDLLLQKIDSLGNSVQSLAAFQTLYKDITLELFQSTRNKNYLVSLEKKLLSTPLQNQGLEYWKSYFYLAIAKGNTDEAISVIKKMQQAKTSQSLSYELYAYAMMAKNDYASAAEYYEKTIKIRPTSNNLYNLSNSHWYNGNTIKAKEYLDESLKLSPIQYKAHNLYGLISLLEGDIDESIESFQKVIEQQPNDIIALSNLGLGYMLKKDYEDALNVFKKAQKFGPEYKTIVLNIADTENLNGDIVEAENKYNQLIEMTKNTNKTNENLRNLAQAYAHTKNFKEALTSLKELEKIDPQNIETAYTAAIVHTLANNKTSAIFNIENALKNGLHPMWFEFSWFDTLCEDVSFITLMKTHNKNNRCNPQAQNLN